MIWIIVSIVEFAIILSTIWVAKGCKDEIKYWANRCCNAESRVDSYMDHYKDLRREVSKLKHENGELKAFIFANLKEVYVKEKKDETNT